MAKRESVEEERDEREGKDVLRERRGKMRRRGELVISISC